MTECGALTPQVLLMTDEARALWIHFHDDVERELRQGGELAEVRDVGSKAADNVARLAALFHLFEHGPSGQVGQMPCASAAAVVGWHLYQARAFLGDVAAPPTLTNAQRLECWLIDHCKGEGNGAVERRTIQNRGPNPVRGGADLDAALSELIAAGRVREIAHGTRRLVEVNPALLGGGNGVA